MKVFYYGVLVLAKGKDGVSDTACGSTTCAGLCSAEHALKSAARVLMIWRLPRATGLKLRCGASREQGYLGMSQSCYGSTVGRRTVHKRRDKKSEWPRFNRPSAKYLIQHLLSVCRERNKHGSGLSEQDFRDCTTNCQHALLTAFLEATLSRSSLTALFLSCCEPSPKYIHTE